VTDVTKGVTKKVNLYLTKTFVATFVCVSPFNKCCIAKEKIIVYYISINLKIQKHSVIFLIHMSPPFYCSAPKYEAFTKVHTYIEKVHISFCKNILCVNRETSNNLADCELGRVPLSIKMKLIIFKFWRELKQSNNCILNACFEEHVLYNGGLVINIQREFLVCT
jgi:hypothetical protein